MDDSPARLRVPTVKMDGKRHALCRHSQALLEDVPIMEMKIRHYDRVSRGWSKNRDLYRKLSAIE